MWIVRNRGSRSGNFFAPATFFSQFRALFAFGKGENTQLASDRVRSHKLEVSMKKSLPQGKPQENALVRTDMKGFLNESVLLILHRNAFWPRCRCTAARAVTPHRRG